MKKYIHILIMSILIFIILQCSFQKRVYRKGFYIDGKKYNKTDLKYNKQAEPVAALPTLKILKKNYFLDKENALALLNSSHTALLPMPHKITLPADSCGDKLILKSGDEYEVKILEITDNEIKYKRCDNFDGPLYSISKKNVYLIKYANGVNEHITSEETIDYTAVKKNTDNHNQSSGMKINPPAFGWALAFGILSIIAMFLGFGGLFLIPTMFLARKARRQINEFPDKYKGKGLMGCLMYTSLIILSIAALVFLIIAFVFLQNPTGMAGALASIYASIYLILGFLIAIPVLIFLFSSKSDDY